MSAERSAGGNRRGSQLGVLGLGVMGRNLAYNLAGRGWRVGVYDPWPEVLESLARQGPKGGPPLAAHAELADFLADLERPRSILMMVKAGEPTQTAADRLATLLEPGDTLIDGGNSHYRDTARRARDYRDRGLAYVGAGISGGEEGALVGPCIMLGGSNEALERVTPFLESAAARVGETRCCASFGPEGAGHYVKMVHNGVEYAEMQMIAEAYALLGGVAELRGDEIAALFEHWNEGPLESYLVGITADILQTRDEETGEPLVERVLDVAGQKGTGRWAAETAVELGVPAPALVEALIARGLSALKQEREHAARHLLPLAGDAAVEVEDFAGRLEQTLIVGRQLIFAQGFGLCRAGREAWGWPLSEARAASVWRGGCIIRARQLDLMEAAFTERPDLPNLLLAHQVREILERCIPSLRNTVAAAARAGIAVPVLGACLSYYDAYRSARLPANLIQAQRDCFGAHGYERSDRSGTFHSRWTR